MTRGAPIGDFKKRCTASTEAVYVTDEPAHTGGRHVCTRHAGHDTHGAPELGRHVCPCGHSWRPYPDRVTDPGPILPPGGELAAAYDALTVALERVDELERAAGDERDDEPGAVLTDYAVAYARQWFDETGGAHARVDLILRDGAIPTYRVNGLLSEALNLDDE